MMKRFVVSVLVLTFAMIGGAQETPQVVATINGEVLTKKDFDRMWDSLPSDMQKSYMASGGKIQFLDNYIRKRLLIQEALKEDFHERDEVKFLVNQAKESALFDAYVRQVVSRDVVPDSEVRRIYEERESEFMLPKRVKARHIVATPDGMAVNNLADSNATNRPEAHEKMIDIHRQLAGNRRDVLLVQWGAPVVACR
ncbi:MAG: SurA N-terminal domain-containing protein [Acidobacteria bacterium]|nr:SurA N-terminal domain-containing protein [Acidobacteriota bacterium]